jgi:ADP-ribose pyrophosphatase YjhB (NUDIX family)
VPAAVAVVIGRRGILLARRARPPYQGTWDLPGGFLEAGEDPERGLLRELREELGVPARILRFLGCSTDRYGPRGFHVLALVYLARIEREPTAQSDVAEARWFPRDRLPWRDIGFPSIRHALRRWRTRK